MRPIAIRLARAVGRAAAGSGDYVSTVLRALFYSNNSLPEGFSFTGTESYAAGGLELDGSEYLEKSLDGTEPWFNQGEEGYLIIRYSTPSFPATDQYLVDFYSGTDVYPSIALRSYRDDGLVRAACYGANSGDGNFTSSTSFAIPANTFHFGALTWDGSTVTILTDNGTNSGSFDTNDTYDTLTIGDDHNGGQTLEGVIAMFEIGTGVPTLAQIFSKAQLGGDKVLNALGQSQANHLFDSLADSSRTGHQNMVSAAGAYFPDPFCLFCINASDSGSALLTTSSASDAWVDNSASPTMADSNRLTDAIADVTARGQNPDIGFWWQYQGDVFDIAATTSTLADYGLALDYLLTRMKALYGSGYKLMLIPNGGRNEAVTDAVDEAHQAMRELFLSKIAEGGGFVRGPEVYDLGTQDTTGHLTNAENAIAGARIGRVAMHHLGYDVSGAGDSVFGPEATGFTNNTTRTVVTLTHDQGSDIPTVSGGVYEGFAVFDADGSQLAVSSTLKAGTNSLKITHEAAAGATVTVKYPYGALEGVDLDKTVKDDSTESMPLQSFVETGITVGAAIPFSMSGYSYASISETVSAGYVYCAKFVDGGRKLIWINEREELAVAACSTAGVASTAGTPTIYNIRAHTSDPSDFDVKPDGSSITFCNYLGGTLVTYDFSTPWGGSLTYSETLDISGTVGNYGIGFCWASDGTKFFISNYNDNSLYQWSAGGAYTLTGSSYDSVSLSVGQVASSNNIGIDLDSTGTTLLITYFGGYVRQWTLSTANVLTGGTYASIELDLTGQLTNTYSASLSEEFDCVLAPDVQTPGTIYQYAAS